MQISLRKSPEPRTKPNQYQWLWSNNSVYFQTDLQFFRIFPIGSLNDFRRSVLGSDPSAMVWYNTFSSPISYSQTQVRTSSRHSQLIIALACWSNRICFAKDARELWTGKVRKGRSQTRLWRGCTRKKVAVWHLILAKQITLMSNRTFLYKLFWQLAEKQKFSCLTLKLRPYYLSFITIQWQFATHILLNFTIWKSLLVYNFLSYTLINYLNTIFYKSNSLGGDSSLS